MPTTRTSARESDLEESLLQRLRRLPEGKSLLLRHEELRAARRLQDRGLARLAGGEHYLDPRRAFATDKAMES